MKKQITILLLFLALTAGYSRPKTEVQRTDSEVDRISAIIANYNQVKFDYEFGQAERQSLHPCNLPPPCSGVGNCWTIYYLQCNGLWYVIRECYNPGGSYTYVCYETP